MDFKKHVFCCCLLYYPHLLSEPNSSITYTETQTIAPLKIRVSRVYSVQV